MARLRWHTYSCMIKVPRVELHMRVYTHICMCIYIYIYIYMYIYIHIHICVYTRICNSTLGTFIMQLQVCHLRRAIAAQHVQHLLYIMYIHKYIHIYIYICICYHIYLSLYIYIYIHIHAYMCTHTYTYYSYYHTCVSYLLISFLIILCSSCSLYISSSSPLLKQCVRQTHHPRLSMLKLTPAMAHLRWHTSNRLMLESTTPDKNNQRKQPRCTHNRIM